MKEGKNIVRYTRTNEKSKKTRSTNGLMSTLALTPTVPIILKYIVFFIIHYYCIV